MLLLVGLGNPGLKFKNTRHNIGFVMLDAFQKENNFPKFRLDKKTKAQITQGIINGKEVLLAKPQTYMNNSGAAVKTLLEKWRLKTEDLIVVHDDFDLPFGKVKMVENSSAAGHHGVESIIKALGTKNFKRIKIGIRPLVAPEIKLKAEDFVLKKFTKAEKKQLNSIITQAEQTIKNVLEN
jgi:PTH1 family peptidyl-tRNA hydrolase